MSAVTAAPACGDHLEGLLALFDAASGGCFCHWWHFGGDDNEWQLRCGSAPDDNRRAFAAALGAGDDEAAGVVALAGAAVVGWLKLCPAERMHKLYRRRVYRTLSCFDGERARTMAIACLLVDPAWRRRGVARALVGAAIDLARVRGAEAIEATPRGGAGPLRDDELWLGPEALLRELGFATVGGPELYPVLRLTLGPRG